MTFLVNNDGVNPPEILTLCPIPCFVCGKALEEVADEGDNHPSGALVLNSFGHYGTKVFDPMDGSWLELNVCDPCLLERIQRVLHAKQDPPRHRPQPRVVYTNWNPDE
jgi:hypothetical protein